MVVRGQIRNASGLSLFCASGTACQYWIIPVNYLHLLIRNSIDAFRGKSFPRRVTAPDGSSRWQSSSGRSFETLEEACNA